MKTHDPSLRPIYIGAALFFLSAGVLLFWGIQTDSAFMGSVPPPPQTVLKSAGDWTIPIINFTASAGFICALAVLALLLYFFPAINSQLRLHKEKKAILVLNIFLGWTFLGWIAALVWSFTSQVEEKG